MRQPKPYKGEEAFHAWAVSRPRSMPGCKSLDACMVSSHTRALHEALPDAWECPIEALATMVGMLAMIHGDKFKSDSVANRRDLVAAWGLASRKEANSVDINESRFLKWMLADSWDSFFEHSQTAIRVLCAYRKPFEVASIYRWVRFRADNPDEFYVAASSQFYHWQHMRTQSAAVPDAKADHDPSLAPVLVKQALEAGYTQSEIAQRCGVSREYIRLLVAGKRKMSFALQALLQQLVSAQKL